MIVLAIGGYQIYSGYRNRALHTSVETISVDGANRSYQLVVPRDVKTPCPVIFAFHGLGDTPDSMATYTKLGRQAYWHNFVLVFPAGERRMWNVEKIDAEEITNHSDVRLFDAILEKLKSNYDINQNRIYAVGMSNGAGFVQLLANARSTVIAAVAAHSGKRPSGLPSPKRAFPIFLLSGADDMAASAVKEDAKAYSAAGHETKMTIINNHGHVWSVPHNEAIWTFLSQHELDVSEP